MCNSGLLNCCNLAYLSLNIVILIYFVFCLKCDTISTPWQRDHGYKCRADSLHIINWKIRISMVDNLLKGLYKKIAKNGLPLTGT